jgi:hypothetical protein
MPGKPDALRTAAWYLLNPLVNFNDYVLGVNDKNYIVHGPAAFSPVAADDGKTGWRWSMIKGAGPIRSPSSPTSARTWFGMRAGMKFNIRNSPLQAV